jgi:hypothetical protein
MKKWHWMVFIGLTLITLVIQIFVPYKQPKWWDKIPLFYSIYGFIGCTLIIFVSKWLGKLMIQKDEKFYDNF